MGLTMVRCMRCPRCGRGVRIVWVPEIHEDTAQCVRCRVSWRECDWRLIRPHVPRVGPLYGMASVMADASARLDDGLAGTA